MTKFLLRLIRLYLVGRNQAVAMPAADSLRPQRRVYGVSVLVSVRLSWISTWVWIWLWISGRLSDGLG